MEPILIVISSEHDCQYFCRACKQLRLWLKGVKLTNCGNCGSDQLETDTLNGTRLDTLVQARDYSTEYPTQAELRDREKRQF